MPITCEQLRNYRWSVLDAATSNTLEHISQTVSSHLHNAPDSAVNLREVIADNSLAALFAARYASCQSSCSPLDLRDSIASVPIPTPDNVADATSDASWLRKLEEAYRSAELERIKILRSSEATIRYRIEVK